MKEVSTGDLLHAFPKIKITKLYRRRQSFILLVLLQGFSMHVFAQQTIKGLVKDESGNALPGVTVTVKGQPIITKTDLDGTYSIKVPALKSVLVFTSVGFGEREVVVNDWNPVQVALKGKASALNDVVVVGYGKNTRELLTTSISKLDTKVLENIPYANATSALQGSIAGLRVQTGSGQPGDAPRVILRGGTSINNPNGATPLYIIDGITRANMNDIAADDIESLQVLKDAAATSIYGSRGSDGVIIITTKTGKAGKTVISYSYDLTVSKKGHTMEYADTKDYIEQARLSVVAIAKKNPAAISKLQDKTGYGTGNDLSNSTPYTTQYLTAANQHKLNEGWESMPDPVDPTKTIIYKSTNFADLLYRTAISNNHYLSVSGGTEKATFNMGAGYLTSEGVAISTDYKRLTLNMNGSLKVSNNVEVTGRILYASTNNAAAASLANTFYRGTSLPGSTKYAFEDGTIAPGQNSSIGNPDYFLKGPYAQQGANSYDNISISLASHVNILPGLTFDPQVSMYKARSDRYDFIPTSMRNGVGTLVTSRIATSSYAKTTQYEASGVLNYKKTFARVHNLSVKAGGSYFKRQNYGFNATGQGASTDLIPTLNASATATLVNGSVSDLVIEGLFSGIDYNYDGRYILSVTTRYDGSSNLGEEHKLGFFPGVSVGWNMHKEKFWSVVPGFISNFKLRASYGVNGKTSGLGDFQAQGDYSVSTSGVANAYAGNAAIISNIIPNPNLKWEQSQTKDIGFDLGLFNRRINFMFDYYDRVTKDLLTSVSLPASTGFSTVLTNLGSLGNKGVEIDLSAALLSPSSALQWTVGFNYGTVKSKILKLPFNGVANNRIGGVLVYDPSVKDYRYLGGLQEGGKVGDYYAYKQIGIYATDEEAAKGPKDMVIGLTDKTKYGGDAAFLDVDNNGIIDDRDRIYLGNPNPTWNGGFSNTLEYKNLFFIIRTDFTGGHTIYNYPAVFADGQLQGDALPTKEYLAKAWKKQGDITDAPRYLWQNQQQNFRPQSSYYQKGDFLCIREVTLGYSLPAKLLERFKIKGIRLNLTGNNLYYFTAYKGNVPEDAETVMDNGHYPIPRNFIFGAKISF